MLTTVIAAWRLRRIAGTSQHDGRGSDADIPKQDAAHGGWDGSWRDLSSPDRKLMSVLPAPARHAAQRHGDGKSPG
jgi:hypothetical protein